MKEFVGKQRNATVEESKNSSQNPTSGHGTTSSPGILTITALEINLAFFSFFRPLVEKSDLAQPDTFSFLGAASPAFERLAALFCPMAASSGFGGGSVLELKERSNGGSAKEHKVQGGRELAAVDKNDK
jgi:hypothetical protein